MSVERVTPAFVEAVKARASAQDGRHNGASKYRRPECQACPYFLAGRRAATLRARFRFPRAHRGNAASASAFCTWGVAVKVVASRLLKRRCDLVGKPTSNARAWQELVAMPIDQTCENLAVRLGSRRP